MSLEKVLHWDRSRLAPYVLPLVILAIPASEARASDSVDDHNSAKEGTPVSIWDRPLPGSDRARGSLVLQTPDGSAPVEPVVLPLPAPVIAAGIGFAAMLVLRRRAGRS